jgi:hypothetical protein
LRTRALSISSDMLAADRASELERFHKA